MEVGSVCMHMVTTHMNFYDRLEAVFARIKDECGLSKQQALLKAGIDPASFYGYKRSNRLPNPEWLERLAMLPEFPIEKSRLKAWRAIDEFGAEVLAEAIKVLDAEREKPH